MDEVTSAGLATIVLVHGGFVDGSGWEGVYRVLRDEGCHVAIVQNSTLSLADDVGATQRVIAAVPGSVVLLWRKRASGVPVKAFKVRPHGTQR